MRVLTAKEIKRVEENAFASGLTEEGLMHAAGSACFAKIMKLLPDIKTKKAAVFCGNGKNAGDGFVIAELLHKSSVDTVIVLADRQPELREPLMYYTSAVNAGVRAVKFDDYDMDCDVIVDCIFGIGFNGVPRSPFERVIDSVNESGALVISIDTPGGTNASDGSAQKAVKADFTIAISCLKYCHVLPPSNALCGDVSVVGIGIPEKCFDGAYAKTIDKAGVKKSFPVRDKNSHKGSCGHQLNICGSYLMPGAAVICAGAALRAGAGLVKCAFPKSVYQVMASSLSQPVFKPLCENEEKTLSMGAVNDILCELDWADCIAVGCGLGNNDDIQVIVSQVIKNSPVAVVLDADGINALSPFIDIIKDRKAPLIITPHPAEMARLIGESIQYVQSNRAAVAGAFAKENDCIVVLKGANTVVTDGKEIFFNTTGNPGMSMGGTGDMLTGMLAAFVSQGMAPFDAAKAAVYIHGLCGDITAAELSQRGMTVDDMLSLLGALMSDFE